MKEDDMASPCERRPFELRADAPVLYILSGLPGSGKSTLGMALSQRKDAFFLRIDTIEQALRDLCGLNVQGEGYRLAYRVAADNLKLGKSVVADSCNPISLTREEWRQAALGAGATYLDIEVICSNPLEHRHRVETRPGTVPGLKLPTWDEVSGREYHPWTEGRVLVDTAGRSVPQSIADLLDAVNATALRQR